MYVNTAFISNLAFLCHLFTLSTACPHHLQSEDHSASSSVRRSVPAAQVKTAITNVRVFDGSCFTPPKIVVFDEGIITSDTENIVDTVDATGQYLIPGLIDNHIHIFNVQGLENLTSYGVTTAMNMACQNYTLCSMLKQQEGLSDFRTASMPAIGPNSNHANSSKAPPSRLVTDASNATDLATWAVRNGSDYMKITLEVNGPSYNRTSHSDPRLPFSQTNLRQSHVASSAQCISWVNLP